MVVRFVVLAPDAKKGSFDVRLPIIVGRSEEAKFRIQQDRVSRKHCEFFEAAGRVFIRDLGSTNGTFLEDEQVPTSAKVAVPSGAVVRVGSLVFRVDYAEAADAAAMAVAPAEDATLGAEPSADDAEFADVNLEPTEDAEPAADFEPTEETEPAEAEAALPAMEDVPDASASPVFTDIEGLPAADAAAEAEPPPADGFDFLGAETAPAQPPAGDDLTWLPADGDVEADAPDDDKLGDFFKGLQ